MSTQLTNSAKKTSSNNLNRQVGMYALAAGVAGVDILALAQPAAGEIVVTHKTIPIPLSTWGREGVGISFANNGVDDLKLVLSSYVGFGSPSNLLKAVNAAEGKGVVGSNFLRYGFALVRGARIGPSNNFVSAACNGAFSCYSAVGLAREFFFYPTSSTTVLGPWAGNHKTAYLGVRFVMNGEPDHFILAGETAKPTADLQPPAKIQNQRGPSLGMLALGADGLPLWRREGTLTSH
jgi:hypothetical protein